MTGNNIEHLVEVIERHKGIFIPDRETYLDWVFRYSCRLMEWYELQPQLNTPILTRLMEERLQETANMCIENYHETLRIAKIYVPSIESIDELLEYDITKRGLTL